MWSNLLDAGNIARNKDKSDKLLFNIKPVIKLLNAGQCLQVRCKRDLKTLRFNSTTDEYM